MRAINTERMRGIIATQSVLSGPLELREGLDHVANPEV
jgi:hypothetical protein